MPVKLDPDTTAGKKLLRLFRKLMLDGRKHFQLDLVEEFNCSPQTIMRLTDEIADVIGTSLSTGLEQRRRWYQIRSITRCRLAMDCEEIRYLSLCRDLAGSALPEQVLERIDDTILKLSMLLNDQGFANREAVQQRQFAFFSKGHIDYTPHYANIEKLMQAAEEHRICLVRYKASGKTETKEHRFAPGRMASMSNTLYVLGAGVTEDFKQFRHFTNLAVHRIQDVIVTDKRFVFSIPEAEPDNFGLPWHEPKTFRVSFKSGKAADYVRERIWTNQQKLEELPDGGVILELTTRSEPELMAWVRSFGEDAKILLSSKKIN